MGINLRGGDIGMPELFLNGSNIGSEFNAKAWVDADTFWLTDK
jgi:glutaredoxin